MEEDKKEANGLPFQRNLCVDGRVKDLSLTVGQRRVLCSFAVIGEKKGFKDTVVGFLPNQILNKIHCTWASVFVCAFTLPAIFSKMRNLPPLLLIIYKSVLCDVTKGPDTSPCTVDTLPGRCSLCPSETTLIFVPFQTCGKSNQQN